MTKMALSYANVLLCIAFAFFCLNNPSQAKTQPQYKGDLHNGYENISKEEIRKYTEDAILYLDHLATRFKNLSCPKNDDFCWWFVFHINIGESGSASMENFVESVPLKRFSSLRQSSFPGESHLFQYPSYWLMKGVSKNSTLRNGQTVEEFVFSKDWINLFEKSEDKELSWYWFGRMYYPELPDVTFFPDRSKTSCQGSHYLVGLSLKDEVRFNKLLKTYYFDLKKISKKIEPVEAIRNPYVSDLVVHSFEAFCLSGRKDLIDEELFFYNLKYLEAFVQVFEKEFANSYSVNEFVKQDSEIAYNTAEILGHYRYGLKVCSGYEPMPF